MQSILEQITDWLKSMIISGIMGNLSGMFDLVNQQVGQIAGDVGTTPANFSPAFFSMIRNILESVLLPIAGMVLTFIACYELIQMLIEHTGQNYLRSLFALGSPYKHRILRSEISAGCPSWVRRQNSGSIFAALSTSQFWRRPCRRFWRRRITCQFCQLFQCGRAMVCTQFLGFRNFIHDCIVVLQ